MLEARARTKKTGKSEASEKVRLNHIHDFKAKIWENELPLLPFHVGVANLWARWIFRSACEFHAQTFTTTDQSLGLINLAFSGEIWSDGASALRPLKRLIISGKNRCS